MTTYKAIRALEDAAGVEPTSFESFRGTSKDERRDYLAWLRRQAPYSGIFIPEFERLERQGT